MDEEDSARVAAVFIFEVYHYHSTLMVKLFQLLLYETPLSVFLQTLFFAVSAAERATALYTADL